VEEEEEKEEQDSEEEGSEEEDIEEEGAENGEGGEEDTWDAALREGRMHVETHVFVDVGAAPGVI
jgi:hypothetical protein